ncbi:MAG: hypothetical protein HY377_00430 [Candidatus Blackburnbacteria bacterium]|nr:hypothetical protein [Candidatus Blackburnbacteria bacterium]
MMLLVDTSNSEKITVGINDERWVEDARMEKSQKLLGMIESKLKEKGVVLDDVSEIKVNTGPGSFTGLRVGISVANALGWLLEVPVNNKNIKKEGPTEPVYS